MSIVIVKHSLKSYNDIVSSMTSTTIDNNDDRYQRGLQKIKRIYGDAWGVGFLDDISPELGRYTVDFLFGDAYDTDKLDAKSREIAIISSLITLGNAPTPLKIHINGALNVGCSREEIIQIIIQMAVYAGFPAAINAIRIAREVFLN
jgi:4-carboxymuconolactone decarboxylase